MQHITVTTRCGYVAIVGRPNVGKSTLINHILGQKLNITSRKPQTTRHRLLGIKTENEIQAIYIDTPGLHNTNRYKKKAINHYMNQTALSALNDVDVVVFIIDRLIWTPDDEKVLGHLKQGTHPTILAVNKIDLIQDKKTLIPWLSQLSQKMPFSHIIPLSILQKHNIKQLEHLIHEFLPNGPYLFDEHQITDRSARFLASEIVREKIMRQMGDELPYQVAVIIEEFVNEPKLLTINALIWVERASQKKMIIGEKGQRLKNIGQDARHDLERFFEQHVMLRLWVKIHNGWSNDKGTLLRLGYH